MTDFCECGKVAIRIVTLPLIKTRGWKEKGFCKDHLSEAFAMQSRMAVKRSELAAALGPWIPSKALARTRKLNAKSKI